MANNIKLTIPDCVTTDSYGRLMAPVDKLVFYEANPRTQKELSSKTSNSQKKLVEDIRANGVLQPIRVFVSSGELHIEDGHRRTAAINEINEEDNVSLGVPITLVPEPESEADRMSSMWKTETQKEPWSFAKSVEFLAHMLPQLDKDQCTASGIVDLTGLTITRVQIMLRAIESEAIFEAAISQDESILPHKHRYQNIRAVISISNTIWRKHQGIIHDVTGIHPPKKEAKEAISKSLIGLAATMMSSNDDNYLFDYKTPINHGVYKQAEISKWLRGEITLDAPKEPKYTSRNMTLTRNLEGVDDRVLKNQIIKARKWISSAEKERNIRVKRSKAAEERLRKKRLQIQ